MMPSVIVTGAGLAGLATAAALGEAGFAVDVYEARPYAGGRATSYPVSWGDGATEVIDNSQHILLRCCSNLLDFYRRLGVSDSIDWHDRFYFIEPGGRTSEFRSGLLPPPAHFTESFIKLRFLTGSEKFALVRGMLALQRQFGVRRDLDRITMAQWLHEQRQPERVVQRFWRQVLVSAVNEELDRMAATHGFQVIRVGFLGGPVAYQMGVPSLPLGELYGPQRWRDLPNVRIRFRQKVDSVSENGVRVDGEMRRADAYVVAVPFENAASVCDGISAPDGATHSPITGVHLWFDRQVTNLPHATLLDRTIHWMFNKGGGQHLQLTVSASRSLVSMQAAEVLELCIRELGEFFPAVREARLLRSRVIKEVRATFSAAPGLEAARPGC
ncbi:MAG: FAD-dependent oxidoreductase, partial [Bryobacteraceae bacterium]|nr:FAD-dependent oxidoreductase [Bryobacteraceae bacterium]